MEISKFNKILHEKEISIIADGLSCNYQDDDNEVIAVNHSYRNINKKPFALVFNDNHFLTELKKSETKELSTLANNIFHGPNAKPERKENIYRFLHKRILTSRIEDGLYGIESSGLSALSLAILMGATKINVHGFDYRVFSDEEAMEYFGKKWSIHTSQADHRHNTRGRENIFSMKVPCFKMYENLKGIEIINHSKYSAIPYFKKA